MKVIKHFSTTKKGIVWDSRPQPVFFIMDEEKNGLIALDQFNQIGTNVQSKVLCMKMGALIGIWKDHKGEWTKEESDDYRYLLEAFLEHCQRLGTERNMKAFKRSLTVEEFTFLYEHTDCF